MYSLLLFHVCVCVCATKNNHHVDTSFFKTQGDYKTSAQAFFSLSVMFVSLVKSVTAAGDPLFGNRYVYFM